MTTVEAERFARAIDVLTRLKQNVGTVVLGKDDTILRTLAALASGGHVLLEDVPGTAKTVLARAIAGSVEGAVASRIQCTPDLQPTDITGLSIWDPPSRSFEFRAGPIFANVVLVDEINRALPKAQSALLEGMAERQVTVDGASRTLPNPFFVIGTENPIEDEGVFPLPEAQLDRFFLRTSLGYPSADDEVRILDEQRHAHPLSQLRPAVTIEDLDSVFSAVADVYVDPLLKRWIVELVRATRSDELVRIGASVRGSLALERGARARALLNGRPYASADDVEDLLEPVIAHRLVLAGDRVLEADLSRGQAVATILQRCLQRVPRPAPTWSHAAES